MIFKPAESAGESDRKILHHAQRTEKRAVNSAEKQGDDQKKNQSRDNQNTGIADNFKQSRYKLKRKQNRRKQGGCFFTAEKKKNK